MPDEIRCTLTLPGAVALGAYEAGAMAALLSALRGIREQPGGPGVRVDSICACSSGSVTALLAARCLVEGLDPVRILHKAWVTSGGLRPLFGRGWDSPLTFTSLRLSASDLLNVPSSFTPVSPQTSPVQVSFGVANLRGLGYALPALSSPGVTTVTHVDWVDFAIGPGLHMDQITGPPGMSVLDAALASAANQLAFPAQLIGRGADEPGYVERGVRNFPATGSFWYADGAFLYREPIGRSLRVARRLDDGVSDASKRLHVVVEPQPHAPGEGEDWSMPDAAPSWLAVLRRSASILQAQSTFDDISRISETNDRLRAVGDLTERLAPVLESLPQETRAQIQAALGDTGDGDLRVGLHRALSETADVAGKHLAALEVIAPPFGVDGLPRPLAGKAFFRFAGFLDEGLRQADFDAGYGDTLDWLARGGLTRHHVPEELTEVALASAHEAYQPPRPQDGLLPPIPPQGKRDFARLLMRVVAVTAYDAAKQASAQRRQRVS